MASFRSRENLSYWNRGLEYKTDSQAGLLYWSEVFPPDSIRK